MFRTEEKMVDTCVNELLNEYKKDEILLEPIGLFGIPDIMINNKEIISIEAKLKNWKRALIQAYRYRSFSKKAYVFMDNDYIDAPLENIEEFKKFNIGLAGVSNEKIEIYYEPEEKEPFSKELYIKAMDAFAKQEGVLK